MPAHRQQSDRRKYVTLAATVGALGLLTLGLFGGTLFIEEVFALPGVGQLANLSAQAGDVPMVMGTVIFVIVLVLVVNFLTDLLSAALNPKAWIR